MDSTTAFREQNYPLAQVFWTQNEMSPHFLGTLFTKFQLLGYAIVRVGKLSCSLLNYMIFTICSVSTQYTRHIQVTASSIADSRYPIAYKYHLRIAQILHIHQLRFIFKYSCAAADGIFGRIQFSYSRGYRWATYMRLCALAYPERKRCGGIWEGDGAKLYNNSVTSFINCDVIVSKDAVNE